MSRIHWAAPAPAAMESSNPALTFEAGAGSFGLTAGGFAVAGPWAAIYRLAYERAVEATQPSRFQKRLEPCWN